MARQSKKTMMAKRRQQRKAARVAGPKQAPGDLEIVRAFVGTAARGRRDDELATPERLGRWLEGRGLLDAGVALGEAEVRRALDLRGGIRAMVLANSGAASGAGALGPFEEAAAAGRFALRFEGGVPVGFAPASRRFEDALGALAGIVAMAKLDGRWPQLKICARGDCGQAFFDTSPNHTGAWCSPQCGERYRSAAFRRRDRRGR